MGMRHGIISRILILLLLIISIDASATWSVIIIDPITRQIGIAGASCSPNCYGIGAAIPGKGAIVVQAMSNNEARERGLQMIIADATPEEIINALRDARFDPERQQYAVITLNFISSPLTYTGSLINTSKGALTGNGISVQGNTLADEHVLQEVFKVIMKAKEDSMSLDMMLMMALEAGSDAGGDKRCGQQKATSAFITIINADDNPRKPFLNLVVFGQHKGGPNAVVVLRKKYDKWIARKASQK
jgi:uncharacterized Ntn-hydrolase superfamily protein